MAADWTALRDYLARQGERVALSWRELEDVVGSMPASSLRHQQWWGGDRPHTRAWKAAGFRLAERQPGVRVVFERVGGAPSASGHEQREAARRRTRTAAVAPGPAGPGEADIVLVSCVKEKGPQPAQARDLYRSALFTKMRAHAEGSGRPWFILSAEHGLVAPDEWLAPYDRYLKKTPARYRAAWGEWIAARLELLHGPLAGRTVEIHAGSTYAGPLLEPLGRRGAEAVLPLAGLTLGERLRWYGATSAAASPPDQAGDLEDVAEVLAARLSDPSSAVTPDALLASDPAPLKGPGLYSWWVDSAGAAELTEGLGHPVEEGMIYAGLAGATRWPSGRRSSNSLWSRLAGMHLGKQARFSTFRLTLGSILASYWDVDVIDEARLTEWMHEHLRVIPVPWTDADRLKEIEGRVLAQLDPPLNLDGMDRTALRRRLTELRRAHPH